MVFNLSFSLIDTTYGSEGLEAFLTWAFSCAFLQWAWCAARLRFEGHSPSTGFTGIATILHFPRSRSVSNFINIKSGRWADLPPLSDSSGGDILFWTFGEWNWLDWATIPVSNLDWFRLPTRIPAPAIYPASAVFPAVLQSFPGVTGIHLRFFWVKFRSREEAASWLDLQTTLFKGVYRGAWSCSCIKPRYLNSC